MAARTEETAGQGHVSSIEMEPSPNHVDGGAFQIRDSDIIITHLVLVRTEMAATAEHPLFSQLLPDVLQGLRPLLDASTIDYSHAAIPAALLSTTQIIIIHSQQDDAGMIGSTHYRTHPRVFSC